MLRRITLIGLAGVMFLMLTMHRLAMDEAAALAGTKVETWYRASDDFGSGQITLWMAPHQTSGVVLVERAGQLKHGWGGSRQGDQERVNSAAMRRLGGLTFLVVAGARVT